MANDHTVLVGGLGVGDYMIQLVDAAGCASNILLVTIPFPDGVLSFGAVITQVSAAMPEHASGSSTAFSSGLLAKYQYYRGRTPHQVQFVYIPPWVGAQHVFAGWAEAEHRSQLMLWKRKKFDLNVAYGLGLRTGFSHGADIDPAFLSLNIASRVEMGKWLHVHAEVGWRGWREIERPIWMVVITVPFLR
jgi:hypothetical protein